MTSNVKEEIYSDEESLHNEMKSVARVKVEIKQEDEFHIDSELPQTDDFFEETKSEEDYSEDKTYHYEDYNDQDEAPSVSGHKQNVIAPDFVSYEIVEYDNYETDQITEDNILLRAENEHANLTNTSSSDDHINVTPMNEWVIYRFMKMSCHLCGATFQHHVYKWLIHIKQQHPEVITKMESLYHMYCKNVAHCKVCKKNVSPEFNHVYHFVMKHYPTSAVPKPFVCTFCEYADPLFASLKKHQVENHPLVSAKCEKCPICFKPFRDAAAVSFHFMTVHIQEFNTRFMCKCHLCKKFSFGSNKEDFFNHLIEDHKLSDWKSLNYLKIEDSSYLLCTKCYKIYINTDLHNLLNHYLTHDDSSSWKCRYCRCKNLFKDWPLPHLCRQMWQYFEYETKHKKCSINNDKQEKIKAPKTEATEEKAKAVSAASAATREADSLISIICTLCENKPFPDTGKIITHFREIHNSFDDYFEKGSKERNRVCKICKTTMNRDKPSDIMVHFLKHLDERPYKCVKCLRSFTEFRAAEKHVKVFHLTDSIDIIGNINATEPIKEERKMKKVVCPNNSNSFKLFEPYILYACPECNEVMPNLDTWEDHINAQHKFFQANNLNIVFIGNGKGKCTDCNTVISISISTQKNHKLTHLQYTTYICAICYERFSMLISLYRHMRHAHLAKGCVQCPLCSHVASTDCEKFEHLKQQHPRSDWPSDMCSKCYRIVSDMDSHRLTHEVQQPKYKCECCGIYVAYHKDLQKHMQEMHDQIIVREKKKKKKSKRKSAEQESLAEGNSKSSKKVMASTAKEAEDDKDFSQMTLLGL